MWVSHYSIVSEKSFLIRRERGGEGLANAQKLCGGGEKTTNKMLNKQKGKEKTRGKVACERMRRQKESLTRGSPAAFRAIEAFPCVEGGDVCGAC